MTRLRWLLSGLGLALLVAVLGQAAGWGGAGQLKLSENSHQVAYAAGLVRI